MKEGEIAAIFNKFSQTYIKSHNPPTHLLKVINAITKCRTKALGGHKEKCNRCGYNKISYNSCRNRHCPKCQNYTREKWLIKRKEELINTVYYHVVFTIPNRLNDLALLNQKVIYTMLFKATSETLLELALDRKHLGGRIGVMAILHTWGQTLSIHPHIHCVVTGGGLSIDGKRWVFPKKSRKKKKFFIHVNIISDLFKKKFLFYLKDAYKKETLKFSGKIYSLSVKETFNHFLTELYDKKWVTYCKRPFGGTEKIIDYLGRYTHKIAITDNRITKVVQDRIHFSYRDYRDHEKVKQTSLSTLDFIHKFLYHVLPPQFFKIRYYGLLSSKNKKCSLTRCRELLGEVKKVVKYETIREWLLHITGVDPAICPRCKIGLLGIVEHLLPET